MAATAPTPSCCSEEWTLEGDEQPVGARTRASHVHDGGEMADANTQDQAIQGGGEMAGAGTLDQANRGGGEMVDAGTQHRAIRGGGEMVIRNRISSRRPNRKFKVPRWILAERLEVFWIDVAKLRKLILLHFGYDPKCRNIDQSPFHKNEAGSQEHNTLTLQGAPTVPLIEDHAATRERWRLNSVTMSDHERIGRKLPGFELMFKLEGHKVEERLHA